MNDATVQARLQALPSIDELLTRPSVQQLLTQHSRPVVLGVLRAAVDQARQRVLAGTEGAFSEADIAHQLRARAQPNLRRVINATGVILHTNLGRAPLAKKALARIAEVGAGYCNLELDLDEGERGSRYGPVVELLKSLTGAEDALVVNNCAAAVLLTFSAFAQGREAIVSRGELVEIGGGFRIPDVMKQSGATLVEVGTTNRTRLEDYRDALTQKTMLLVKIHQSNFAMQGFVESVSLKDLAALGSENGITTFCDLGSGLLNTHASFPQEPTVRSAIAAGIDLVAFSGDKLLGGPQCGIVVGSTSAIARLKKHPLNRALRIDKLTVAALEATLEIHRDGTEATELPAHHAINTPVDTVKARAARLQEALASHGLKSTLEPGTSRVGGGTLPAHSLPTWVVSVTPFGNESIDSFNSKAEQFHGLLRDSSPPIVARTHDGKVVFDLRTVNDEEVAVLAGGTAIAVKRLA